MKITRIKCCNLASLAGVVELDLTKGALAQAGLFAITGPTGSGKTTLLDALCLALFDQTPRLQEANGRVKIGRAGQEHDALSAQSPRSLLRHDAGSGYAEVDFESTEGRPFCARWEVRRAGDKASGRLQSQKMTLTDLITHQVMGSGTRTETKELIVEHLGLNFDQFTRSALLAQGQFASFLKAKRGERAELLERMTGTDLYARISEQAFAKNKAAKEALQALEARKGDLALLTPLELTAKRATLSGVGREVEALEGEQRAQKAHAEWTLRVKECSDELERAKTAAAAAQLAWDQASPERARLERFESAALQLERLALQRSAQSKLNEQVLEVSARRSTLTQAEDELSAKLTELKRYEDERAATLERAEELGPRIQRAQDLEGLVLAALCEQSDARAQLEERKSELLKAEVSLQELQEELRVSQALVKRAQTALALDPQAKALVVTWPRVRKDLETAAELKLRLRQSEGLQEELDALTTQQALAQAALSDARGKLASARSALQEHKATAPLDLEKLRAEQTQLEGLELRVQGQDKLVAELNKQLTALEGESALQQEQLVKLSEQHAKLSAALPQAEIAANDSSRLRELGSSTLTLEEHRHVLIPGEPCPLCGSPEHPGVDPSAVVISALKEQEESTREALDCLRLALQKCSFAKEQAQREQEKAQAQRLALLPDLAQASAKRGELLEGFSDLQALSDHLAASRAALRQREDARALWQAKLTQLELELTVAEGVLQSAETAATQSRAALEASKEQDQAQARDSQAWTLVQERLGEELRALSTQPLELLAQDPGALLSDWEQRVPRAEAHQQDQLRGERQVQELQAPLATAQAQRSSLLGGLSLAEKLLEKRTSALNQLREAQLVLGIPDPGAAAKTLQAAIKTASQAFDKAKEQEQGARRAQALAVQSLRNAQEAVRKLKKELEEIQLALEQSLGDLSLKDLQELQAWDPAEREAAQARRASLKASLQSSTAIHGVRQEALKRLHESEPNKPALDPLLPPVEERLKQIRTRFLELELELREQQKMQGQNQSLITEIAQHREANRRWAVLNTLIGSKDGDRFRQFAQGLTLESLLAHANGHLKELSPRYLLARVPGEDLELQIVDQAMAGDVRSVNSLSGGETFLTSLALALGLASLSASQTPVRTLFIDEGFGSLDPKSLDTALATLDALQAGGRQVGIISHVAGIGDHIGVQVRIKPIAPGRSQVLLP